MAFANAPSIDKVISDARDLHALYIRLRKRGAPEATIVRRLRADFAPLVNFFPHVSYYLRTKNAPGVTEVLPKVAEEFLRGYFAHIRETWPSLYTEPTEVEHARRKYDFVTRYIAHAGCDPESQSVKILEEVTRATVINELQRKNRECTTR